MKNIFKSLCAGMLLLGMSAGAWAEIITTGAVIAGQTVLERAQLGGTVAQVEIQTGSYVQAGDAIATLSLSPVYAPCDGTVESVFAHAGESADDTVDKYAGVMSLRPEAKYILYATAEYAYQSLRTEAISSGQTVYLKCTANGTHQGTGRITSIDGEIFTIEAIGGEFYTGETVYVYMEDDCEYADRLGKATVVATPTENIGATGDIVNMYVEPGDFVEKGQLLFETVSELSEDGALLPLTARHTGYVIALCVEANRSISKDDPLVEICPVENLLLACEVSESDISAVQTGASVVAGFELPEGFVQLTGTVSHISYLPTEGDATTYQVRIALQQDLRIRPGMTADVSIGN